MSRLRAELQRLYLLPDGARRGPGGELRALVLELARPADWEALSRVWRGVQAELELPAPAIAVSGHDGLQLWFSLQQPVAAERGAALLTALKARYLAHVAPARLRAMPSAGPGPAWEPPLVPAQQPDSENWSAFVAPDLAPVFADTPWLDIPPGTDGQADLLARLQSVAPAAFDAALLALQPTAAPAPTPMADAPAPANRTAEAGADIDPRRFLQDVLNDATAPLALRVQAAQALLRSPGDA
jgi:hypothetical protein